MGVTVKFYRGAWWIFIHAGGRRRSKKVGDHATALEVARRIREQLALGDLGLLSTARAETLDTYAQSWLRGLTGNLKASTIRFYSDNLRRYVLPAYGTRPLQQLTRQDCRELIATCRGKGLKLNTVKGIARTLSALLSQAVEDEKIAANPALRMGRYLRRGDEPKTELHPLTRAEAAHLIATAERYFPRWYPWILLALRTGLRLGEQLAVNWGDIDFNGRFVAVQRNIVRGIVTSPKSHQRRRVDLSPQLITALLQWRRVQRTRWLKKGKTVPPWVFPSLERTALEERNVRHVFTRMLEKAELRQVRIHDLRHSYATHLLQAGAPITYVSQQLGHADASITLRVYAHYLPDSSAQRGVDRLDDAVPAHPNASPAHPEGSAPDDAIVAKSFVVSGEPRWNRTINPQIKSLLLCQLS
jgi:integrase